MIEIIIIIALASNIKKIVIVKGLKPAKYIVIMILLWIFLELLGGVVGVILFGEGLAVYFIALIGASLGGFIGYRIAKNADSPIEQKMF